jgi:Holliday junction resolvasome RuvABC endonuclease subunit
MKILSLDISTKTGWAFAEIKNNEFKLLEYGICKKRNIKDYSKDYVYPADYLNLSNTCFNDILKIYQKYQPDILVIEETSKGSKNNYSQKTLEFIHYNIANFVTEYQIPTHYFMTGEWRNICNCKMNNEEKKQNKNVKTQKVKTGSKIAKNEKGKRIGKITKKHVNVRRANELFDLELKLKDEDKADAILLSYAYHILKFGGQGV